MDQTPDIKPTLEEYIPVLDELRRSSNAAYSGLIPAGVVLAYGGTTAPPGWLLADGSLVSRTTYASLFFAIGTRFGAGDGSTTFALPDLRQRVVAGYKNGDSDFGTIGQTGGETTHTLTETEMPRHTHENYLPRAEGVGGTFPYENAYAFDIVRQFAKQTGPAGSSMPHNNLQPYITLNQIIKT